MEELGYLEEERLDLDAGHEAARLKQLAIDAAAFKSTDLYRYIVEQMSNESESARGALTVVNPTDLAKIVDLQITVQAADKAVILLEQVLDFGVGEGE
jgi:hypothetical protein